jgi:very-short-patch-repair endonuclease
VANETARALRKRLTPQEVKLWVKLRELKPFGFHFRRQAPIGPFIVDFVSFRSKVIIEADGGQHGLPDGVRTDQARDAFLRSQGFTVLRFWNSEIDANLSGVMECVPSALRDPPPDRPSASHPKSELRSSRPHEGEG